jgi:N-acetylmuramoyl-L-alanine amidase/FG-GAP-like repeat
MPSRSRLLPWCVGLAVVLQSASAPAGAHHETARSTPAPVEPTLQIVPLTSAAMRRNAEASPPLRAGDLARQGTEGGIEALRSAEPVVATNTMATEPFRLVAVTWRSDDARPTAWVRTRADGTWSKWYRLATDDEHGPDPGSTEARTTRSGTEPLVVPHSDGVQVRVASDSGVPPDLRLDLIDPGRSSVDAKANQAVPAAAATVPRPTILNRAQWGADESLREPGSPDYGVVNGAFVHHTVNANDYSAAEVPAIIRGIYAYHVNSRGWRDIGYNFLVDKFGRIWEGRYGGIDRAVIGAHTQGYNDDAFAMSAIGTYTSQPPSAAMITAFERLFSWKFFLHGVDPDRPVDYDGESWPAIAGHRDAADTECPGGALYARLPTIRAAVQASMPTRSPHAWGWRDFNGDGLSDIVARRTVDGALMLWPGRAEVGYSGAVQIGTGWQGMDVIVRPGDWDGDRRRDVIARVKNTGTLLLYPGNGRGGFGTHRVIGSGWGGVVRIITPGDWNGDRIADLIATFPSGAMLLYPGAGGGSFRPPTQIGQGWARLKIAAPGDWTGDGAADLLAIASDNTLWLYPGTGFGGFRAASPIGSGWHNFPVIAGAGDADNDLRADLLAWTPAGNLWLYPGDGHGGFGTARLLSTGWGRFDQRS